MLERTAGAGQMEEQVEDVSGDCTSDGAAMVSPSRLVVIRVIREKGKKAVAVCKCECGNEKVTQLAHVKSGAVKSCGCLKRETSAATGEKNKKHGHSSPATRSHTYRSWETMKARCLNANDPSFKDYGARGITVEDAWMTFETFLADMGERPRGTTLDRIDVNAGYGKNNCRWATPQKQQRNKRNNRMVFFRGESIPLVVLAEKTGVPYQRLHERIVRRGWSVEDAIRKPSIAFN